jgi:uncharacterized protein YecT (DUF1311 family)
MTRQRTNTCKIIFLFLATILSINSRGDNKCQVNCVLKSAANDQNCAIETVPLVRCENFKQFKRYDKQLNVSYRSLRGSLNNNDRESLKKTQINWINWRDEICDDLEVEANCNNGMCTGVAHDSCIVFLTEQRNNELDRFKENINNAKAVKFEFSKARPDEELFELP